MTRVIVLDSEPLGLVTNPKANPDSLACNLWLENWLDAEARVLIPGIADYEVRRELIRANKRAGLQRLDDFRQALEFVPIAQEALFRAADLWAAVRQQGKQTASDKALDGDVILAAQVLTLDPLPADVVVATTNPGHLARFIAAEEWSKIVP